MDEKGRKALLDSVTKKIIGSDGKIEKEDLWGVRALTYQIKRETSGYYAHYEILSDPKNAKGLDKFLDLEEDILRYLFIRK